MIQKPFKNREWQRVTLSVLAFCLLLAGCISLTDNSETEANQTSSASENIEEEPTSFPDNLESDFVVSEEPLPQPSLTPPMLTTTLTSTLTSSNTSTSVDFPEMLLATIQIKQKGEEDETHEVWLMNTQTEENRLVFTTTPGTRLATMKWGGAV
jgi:hypothetical protein